MLSGILHLGACPNQEEEEQQFAMTAIEALRLQLDNLQKEKQELQVRTLRLSQTQPDVEAITEIEKERDHWKEKYEGVVVENSQLKALYEELLKSKAEDTSTVNSAGGYQTITELQEQLLQEEAIVQQWKCKCEEFNREVTQWKSQCALLEVEMGKLKEECNELAEKLNKIEATLELECYRAEAKVRKQWEAREDRLVQQLQELQHQRRVQEENVLTSPKINQTTKNVSTKPPVIDQQKSPQYSASRYQSTKGVQWVGLDNIPGEESTMSCGVVSKPVVGSLESFVPLVVDNTVTHGVCNSSLSHVPSEVQGDQPLVRTTVGEVVDSNPITTHVDHFATALLAQQLPPLPKFSGESGEGELETETFQEWLDQFEMVADICDWSPQAKLVNLITRLRGQAYAFFRSCTMVQRTNYSQLVTELRKRFTPVSLPIEHSSLFHDKKQGITETVDQYAQELRFLFYKAYPSIQQGTKEAETFGQTVLANQFVAGLLPEIKSKLVGIEGGFSHLLAKARFEEAKLHHLGPVQSTVPVSENKVPDNLGSSVGHGNETFFRPQRSNTRFRTGPRCYNCGSSSHLLKQCPYPTKQKFSEATGHGSAGANITRNTSTVKGISAASNVVSNVTPMDNAANTNQLTADPHLESNNADVDKALDSVIVRMHGITSRRSTEGDVQLGPVLTARVTVEGEVVEALLDTGSPVTIIQLEALLEILAKQRQPSQTPSEWRKAVETRLEPTSLILQNYSGDSLKIVRQIKITMSRPGYSTSAVVQVQKGAPAKLLVGTDLLSQLGYFFIQTSEDSNDSDMLATESDITDNLMESQSIQQQNKTNEEKGNDDHAIESNNEGDLTQCKVVYQNDTSVKEGSELQNTGTVCLVQATRIPARHQKMVRVKVTNDCCYRGTSTMFESNYDMMETHQLLAPNTLTCLDHLKEFTLVLENHGCQPIYLQPGQPLECVEDVVICPPEEVQDSGDNVPPAAVNTLLVESAAEQTTPTTNNTEAAKQKRLTKLKETLTIHQSNLSPDQLASLMELVEQYSEIFALDVTELGCTNLVTHSIDTGDSPPICQTVRHVPFALHAKMEQLVQEMIEQGVIQHSSSPWASPVVLVKKKRWEPPILCGL